MIVFEGTGSAFKELKRYTVADTPTWAHLSVVDGGVLVKAERSLAYLRESVASPDADVTPGYATITVVTRDGKKIIGVERGFDNFSAQLMDVSGRYYSFQKDNVMSIQREYRSLRPSN